MRCSVCLAPCFDCLRPFAIDIDFSIRRCKIGAGAVVAEGSVMEEGGQIAAGTVVPPGCLVPKNELWAGNPAK